jgi:hypothetical protein
VRAPGHISPIPSLTPPSSGLAPKDPSSKKSLAKEKVNRANVVCAKKKGKKGENLQLCLCSDLVNDRQEKKGKKGGEGRKVCTRMAGMGVKRLLHCSPWEENKNAIASVEHAVKNKNKKYIHLFRPRIRPKIP